METKLLVFDLNGVLTDRTLAVDMIRYIQDEGTRLEAIGRFRRYKTREIGDREIVVEGSKCFKGLPYEVIQRCADSIEPRIRNLNLPGWQSAIISLDYQESVKRIADLLGVPRYYGNRIIYENGLHSGRVEEPIVDFDQKEKIVLELKEELNAGLVVGVDDEENSPFESVCDQVYHASTKEELERALGLIRKL
jgi:phosphoserine phosphatase